MALQTDVDALGPPIAAVERAVHELVARVQSVEQAIEDALLARAAVPVRPGSSHSLSLLMTAADACEQLSRQLEQDMSADMSQC